jgi:putative serine protease PepD
MLIPDKLWSAGDPPREAPRTAPHAAPPDPPAPDSGRPPGGRGRRRAVAAVAVAAALGAGGGVLALGAGDEAGGPAPLPASASTLPGLGDNRNDVREIYRAASPAVVSVRAEGSGGEGTGFLVDGDGTIVTNAHVAGEAERAQVSFGDDGRTVAARVLGSDPSSDIAVLRVDAGAVAGVRPLPLADSDSVQVGDAAVAIGNPFGLDRTATAGIVSALEREITAPNGFSIEDVIQTDAPINPGNSGGPLLNARGQVIGVNSQIQSGGLRGNVGIGFAVPSNAVREVLPRLQQGETIERAWLGVSSAPDAGGDGARVQEVTAGSPAQRAGLRAGDVIVSVDGRAVAEPSDIAAAIEDRQPGDSVRIEVLRGGARETFPVELGTRPANTSP